MKHTQTFLLLGSLTGCSMLGFGETASDPKSGRSSPPPGISYRVKEDDFTNVTAKAKEYCKTYGKRDANVEKTQPPDKDGERLVTFKCV